MVQLVPPLVVQVPLLHTWLDAQSEGLVQLVPPLPPEHWPVRVLQVPPSQSASLVQPEVDLATQTPPLHTGLALGQSPLLVHTTVPPPPPSVPPSAPWGVVVLQAARTRTAARAVRPGRPARSLGRADIGAPLMKLMANPQPSELETG